MGVFFFPAIYLLNRLGFLSKFILIFFCVSLPLMVLSMFMLNSINDDIHMLENESRGVVLISATRQSMDLLQQHRGLMAALIFSAEVFSADAETQTRAHNIRNQISSSLTSLITLQQELGVSPQLQQNLQSINQRWINLSTTLAGLDSAESFLIHTELIASIIRLQQTAADYFQLTLSPDLDTYYLGDAVVHRLPALTESMGQARAHASSAAAQSSLTTEQRIQLEVLLYNMATQLESLETDLSNATDAAPELIPALRSAQERNRAAVTALITLLRSRILDTDLITVSSTDIFDSASASINHSYALYDAIIPELNTRLLQKLSASQFEKNLDISIVISTLILLCYMFASLFYTIKTSVDQISGITLALSGGNLAVRTDIQSSDELRTVGEGINRIAAQFESLIKKILNATSQLASAAEELSSVSRHSTDNVLKQRAETDMVAVSINEMNTTVQEVSQSTSRASISAADANDQSLKGAELARKTADAIRELSEEINLSAQGMQRVSADSQTISGVLDVIMGVAEQTNLLALNAAIEAARAGKFGRGFAVVADEVRTLANRTKDSANEIDVMIRNLQNGVHTAVDLMERSREKAATGVNQATDVTQALDTITQAVTTIRDMNLQIASAAEQQSATTEELNRNVTSIRELAEQSSAGAAQTTVASDELAKLAAGLQDSVSWFQISAA